MATPIIADKVAGPFLASFLPAYFGDGTPSGSDSLGIIGERGIREIRRYEGEEIGADLVGMAGADATYLGYNLYLEFELESVNRLSVMRLTHPFSTGTSAIPSDTLNEHLGMEGTLGVPGTFYTDKGGALILTPAYGVGVSALNSAGAQTTPVRRYGLCSVAPGFEWTKLLASRRRTFPVRLRCWPYLDNGRYVYYTKQAS